MDIILPRIPDELWREHIFISLQSIRCPLNQFKKIELMLRIGNKRKIKQCSEILEYGYMMYKEQLIMNVSHYIEQQLKKHVDDNLIKIILSDNILDKLYYITNNKTDINDLIFTYNTYTYTYTIFSSSTYYSITFNYNNFSETWAYKTLCHRIDGPAQIYREKNILDSELWYNMGQLHRIGGPATIIWQKNKIIMQAWYEYDNMIRHVP